MTRIEFLLEFARVVNSKTWQVTEEGCIRHRRTNHCPLSWVASRKDKTITPCLITRSGTVLNLRPHVACNLARAADGDGNCGPTRRALLTAIGQ